MKSEQKCRIAIYSRKSKFTGKGESIDNQIELCRQHIKSLYPEKTDDDIDVFEDEGFSGKNIDRPRFKEMMKKAESKQYQAIVCYRLDRISRNTGDFAKLIDQLNEMKIDFISIKENFTPDNPMGKAMMYIASIFAQLERETIAERIIDNMQELAKTGRWLGGMTPTGYRSEETNNRIEIDGKIRKMHKLEMVQDEAEVVKLIFNKYIELNSLTKVEEYLFNNNLKTKNNKAFSRYAIKHILENPVYMSADIDAWDYFEDLGVNVFVAKECFDGIYGIMAYNKTIQTTSKSHDTRDIKEWIIAIGRHLPVVNGRDWVKVQQMLLHNKSKSYRKPKSTYALLSGLLFCEHCGAFMRPKVNRKILETGEKSFSYLCETKEKTHKNQCDMKNPSGNDLDLAICKEIQKLSSSRSEFMKCINEAKSSHISFNRREDSELQLIEGKIHKNKSEIDELVKTLVYADKSRAYSYIVEQINKLDKENERLQSTVTELRTQKNKENIKNNGIELMREILLSFSKTFDIMSYDQKRSAIRVFIDKITWDGESAHIYFLGAEHIGDCKIN